LEQKDAATITFAKKIMNLNPFISKKQKREYSEIFAMNKIIAKDVIDNFLTEKEAAAKYCCSWQLIKTFVRESHENSHLKISLYGQI